jgi:hypothetical protein
VHQIIPVHTDTPGTWWQWGAADGRELGQGATDWFRGRVLGEDLVALVHVDVLLRTAATADVRICQFNFRLP